MVWVSRLVVHVVAVAVAVRSVLLSLSSSPPLGRLWGYCSLVCDVAIVGALLRVLRSEVASPYSPTPVFPGGHLSLQRHHSSLVAIQPFLEVTGHPEKKLHNTSSCAYTQPLVQWLKLLTRRKCRQVVSNNHWAFRPQTTTPSCWRVRQ